MNIGVLNSDVCLNYNLTGVMARSCGIKRDLRLSPKDVYSSYNTISFKSYFGVNGDCFDRYLIRMLEMGESLHISNCVINKLLSSKSNITKLITTTTRHMVASLILLNDKFAFLALTIMKVALEKLYLLRIAFSLMNP